VFYRVIELHAPDVVPICFISILTRPFFSNVLH